jgi:hypothetical protein
MSGIHIQWLGDFHDCETCGSTYASGARITIDGAVALEFIPVAHCFNGADYGQDDVYRALLEHLGHTVQTEDPGEP